MDVVLPEHFGGPPKELICPITQEMMVEPVIAADGHTYERESIERWLSGASHQRSPTTNAAMLSRNLTANRLVSSMIAAYTSRLGIYRKQRHLHILYVCVMDRRAARGALHCGEGYEGGGAEDERPHRGGRRRGRA